MRVKNFVHQTRPRTAKELRRAIEDTEKQIHYLQSIGRDDYAIGYYKTDLSYLKSRLARKERRKE